MASPSGKSWRGFSSTRTARSCSHIRPRRGTALAFSSHGSQSMRSSAWMKSRSRPTPRLRLKRSCPSPHRRSPTSAGRSRSLRRTQWCRVRPGRRRWDCPSWSQAPLTLKSVFGPHATRCLRSELAIRRSTSGTESRCRRPRSASTLHRHPVGSQSRPSCLARSVRRLGASCASPEPPSESSPAT